MDKVISDQPETQPIKETKFCSDCGAEISRKAEICPKCGVRQMPQTSDKSPVVAAILNLIIVGLGHVYLGRVKRGVALFLLAIIIAILSAGLGWIFGMFVCAYDAYQLAQNKPAPLDFLEKHLARI
jgi:TM2 domain-containing membrane protein YozV